MNNIKNKKKLQIMIFVFIAVITLGIGYAAISAINLVISGNATGSPSQSSFSIVFKSASLTSGTGTASIDEHDSTVAYFDVSGLSKTGDTAVATYTIKNESNGVGASISLNVTNSNTEYFQVTESILDTELQANEQTTATITVEMIKTPIESNVTTSVVGIIHAIPMENANATGSVGATTTPADGPQYRYSLAQNNIGQVLIEELPSFEAAKIESNRHISQAHIVSGGVITESYVAFEINNTVYYLKGGIDESSQSNKPVYNANIATLKEAFGPNWQSACSDYNNYFGCILSDNVIVAYVYENGEVNVFDYGWGCFIENTNIISCRAGGGVN